MKRLFISGKILPCVILCLTSCGEDPKLVAVREQQKAEISRLRGELALIEEKLSHMPKDLTSELETARGKAEQQKTEIARLESEIAELESRKRSLQQEFDSYRLKYQVK